MDKEHTAISRLRQAAELSKFYYHQPLTIAYSGGKDSEVCLELAKRAGISFRVRHSLTTADAPETVRHVRRKFRELELMSKYARKVRPGSAHGPADLSGESGREEKAGKGDQPMSKKGTQAQRYQGMVNRAQGKLFEERIDAALAYYDRLGVASVEKTPEPMRPLKRLSEGRFVAVFEKPAQPDYKGTLKGGRAVVFEAKHTSTGQMEQSRVTDAQAKRLDQHQALGALCFVVAGFGSEEVFRVPWKVWRDMKAAFGRKYVTPKDLEEYRVRLGRSGVLLLLEAGLWR